MSYRGVGITPDREDWYEAGLGAYAGMPENCNILARFNSHPRNMASTRLRYQLEKLLVELKPCY